MIECQVTHKDGVLTLEFFQKGSREVITAYIRENSAFVCKANEGEIVLRYECFGRCALHAVANMILDSQMDIPRTKEFSEQVLEEKK